MEGLPPEKGFTDVQRIALIDLLENSKESRRWLNLASKRKEAEGNPISTSGVDLEHWSEEIPGGGRRLIGIGLPLVIAAGLGYITYTDAIYTVEAARTIIPPALDGFLQALTTPDFHLTNPEALKPVFDFSNFSLDPRNFRPDIRVQMPNPGVAFDPVVLDHQRKVNEALEIVKQGILRTATLTAETITYGVATLVTAIKYHPFREIQRNNILFSKQIGQLIYGLGRVVG